MHKAQHDPGGRSAAGKEGRKGSMIKLGDTVNVNYGNTTKMWLVKDTALKRFAKDHPEFSGLHYKVLGFIPGKGWYTANNGTLKAMRDYITSKM